MARARNIKPSFFKNELLAELHAFDRLLFIGLWCLADREGRLENRVKRIKMELFPCDAYDVEHGLSELERLGFIERYTHLDKDVVSIVNFHKHQTPHGTEKDSDLPSKNGELTVNERGKNGYVTGKKPASSTDKQLDNMFLTVKALGKNTLNPDILNPDILNPEKNAADAIAPEPAGFAEFWQTWPTSSRKGGKANCLAKWKKSHFEKQSEKIIAHVHMMRKSNDWQKNSGEFVPAPLTYLNQCRWDGSEQLQMSGIMPGAI